MNNPHFWQLAPGGMEASEIYLQIKIKNNGITPVLINRPRNLSV